MVVKQTTTRKNLPHELASKVSTDLVTWLDQWISWPEQRHWVVMDDLKQVETILRNPNYKVEEPGLGGLVHLYLLNEVRFINKFLEAANEKLRAGGYLVGCVETSRQRRERLMKRMPRPVFEPLFLGDYLVHRVWPKLSGINQAYFQLTRGRYRVMSQMEVFGRLYACGFRLTSTLERDGKLYFLAEKTGCPAYDTEASYGPLITLRRVGREGDLMKVFKVRTMAPYSEYLQAYIYEQNGLQSGGKLKDDPRVTIAGKIFRKYWIDELPMLYHLLRGDLKLFGVRPISQHYFSLYPEDFQEYRKRFKPGLIPPVYVEIPETLEDVVAIERRYLEAYEKSPLLTDLRYLYRCAYNIVLKKVRSK